MSDNCRHGMTALSTACAVQTVSERLSQHVLKNYSRFVAGVTEVASVERDLQVNSISWTLPQLCPSCTGWLLLWLAAEMQSGMVPSSLLWVPLCRH